MSQQQRTGQDYLKNLFYSENLLCPKKLPWFFLSLDVSNFLTFSAVFSISNNQYYLSGW